MSFAPGALVHAAGREWVVQPESSDDLVLLRPVGGADNEVVGILPELEQVSAATFDWPGAEDVGSAMDAALLRDAVRLGFRSSAGPFRSFAKIALEPRPYQLVPLLMAMRLDPVRLLIADGVGTGKTASSLLIAVELMATGQADRLAVLCPPHLADQWVGEMTDKFNLEPTLVLSSTAPRLERGLGFGESLFDRHRITVVSTDFIKSDRRRAEFLRSAPELIVVDEAHGCAADPSRNRSARHQRHELVVSLAADERRHMVLATATPHSGKEGAFRSLLGLLHPRLRELPPDEEHYPEWARDLIAQHFIQRDRHDLRSYAAEETPFPEREELPEVDGIYRLTPEYDQFLLDVREFARERITDSSIDERRQRMRYWSILGLLRHVASSPRAAATTLRNRNPGGATETADEADTVGRAKVLDGDLATQDQPDDTTTGVIEEDDPAMARITQLAEEAQQLEGPKRDAKLAHVIKLTKSLLKDGFNPIVFCKYIPTAEYYAEQLREALPARTAVDAVTGRIPADQRDGAVQRLVAAGERRVLVATDCLAEGINLQNHFSAVVSADLPWSPTVTLQREGRVDRFGQPAPVIRTASVYSPDTIIDELVMDVLLRKHRTIRNSLGVSVPVPTSSDEFLEKAVDRLFATDRLFVSSDTALLTDDQHYADNRSELFDEWDRAAHEERRSRTRYAQQSIHTDEVKRELEAVRSAIGSGVDIERFLAASVTSLGGIVEKQDDCTLRVDLARLSSDLRDSLRHALDVTELPDAIKVRTQPPVTDQILVTRTHPFVATLASYVLDSALDPNVESVAARAGIMRTASVDVTTALLLLRHRYDLVRRTGDQGHTSLVEETSIVGYTIDANGALGWLEPTNAETLASSASPAGNLGEGQRRQFAAQYLRLDAHPQLGARLVSHAHNRAEAVLAAHRRIRQQAGGGLGRTDIEPHLPLDVLAAYVLVPSG